MWQVDPGIPVLVPRRADHGHRDTVWATLQEHVWADANIIEGHHDGPTPFNRSAALNTAADLAGDWEHAVIADADSFTTPAQLLHAVTLAKTTGRAVIAHSRWVNVTLEEQAGFLNGGWVTHDDDRMMFEFTVSSMLVIPRTVWDTVNGFDARFTGWGAEDRAFMRAVRVLCDEPLRVHGDVYHLAHDRPTEDTHRNQSPTFQANNARWRTYRGTRTREAMAELVAGNRA